MKLAFHHSGLQFFFVTLTLEGRPQALSRLVRGERGGEVALLPPGEAVVAFLRAIHAVYPAVTISDRQIMPDHIHFLMIVRYDAAPSFNPLWVSFALMAAIEEAWSRMDGGCAPEPLLRGGQSTPAPGCAPEPLLRGGQPTPAASCAPAPLPGGGQPAPGCVPEPLLRGGQSTPAASCAPEPLLRGGQPAPGCAPSPEEAAVLLGQVVARERRTAAAIDRLMGQGLARAAALSQLGLLTPSESKSAQPGLPPAGARGLGQPGLPPAGARGLQVPVRSEPLRFDRRAYIELSFDSRQLKAIRRYIRLNPSRVLWKRLHPDRFIRFANIGHAVLDPRRAWAAMGNLTLLGSPFLLHARLTLKKTLAEHEATICDFVAKAQRGAVIVSGFISPGEVELLRRLKATPGARFIKMLPCTLPPRYDPSAEDSRELAADRLLILSGFTNTTPHISAIEMRRDPAAAHLFRANCLEMNALAAALCERAKNPDR